MFTILVFFGGVAAGAAFTPFWVKVWSWVKGEAKVAKADLAAAQAKVQAAAPASTPEPTATAAK